MKFLNKINVADKNGNWRGDNVGYNGIHDFMHRRMKQPKSCQSCGKITSNLDLANISQKYKRVVDDWEWLCRKCHMQKDGRMKKFGRYKKDWKKGWETRRVKYGQRGGNKNFKQMVETRRIKNAIRRTMQFMFSS